MPRRRLLLLGAALCLLPPAAASAWREAWTCRFPAFPAMPASADWLSDRPLRHSPCPSLGARAVDWRAQAQGFCALYQPQLHGGTQTLTAQLSAQPEAAAGGLQLLLCADQPGPAGLPWHGYAFRLDRSGLSLYKCGPAGARRLAGPRPAAPADWSRFSLTARLARGRLSLALDGRELLSATDHSYPGGHAGFGALGQAAAPAAAWIRFGPLELRADRDLTVPEAWRPEPRPLLEPSRAWEQDAVFEPSPLAEPGGYRLAYSGGWDRSGIGIALSADGVRWRKAAARPVLGLGQGGEDGPAVRPHLLRLPEGYRLYYADAAGDLRLARSLDGLRFQRDPEPVLRHDAVPGVLGWASQGFAQVDGRWWALVEAQHVQPPTWRLHLLRSRDQGLHFEPLVPGAVESLQVGFGAWCSPRALRQDGRRWDLWYHVSEGAALLPTVLWHASGAGLGRWTPDPYRSLGLAGHSLGLEAADQVADPAWLDSPAGPRLFYDITDNTHKAARIGAAGLAPGWDTAKLAALAAEARRCCWPLPRP